MKAKVRIAIFLMNKKTKKVHQVYIDKSHHDQIVDLLLFLNDGSIPVSEEDYEMIQFSP